MDEPAYEPKTPVVTEETKTDPDNPHEVLFSDEEIDDDPDEGYTRYQERESLNE